MSYDVFPCTMHTVTHAYPKGDVVQFGKGYQFNATPQLPFQRRFRLSFKAAQWFFNVDGTVDLTTHPEFNMGVMDAFFQAHDYSKPFTYPHTLYGNITVKFAADQAFEIPKAMDGGTGVTEPFEIFLVEQPGL